MLPTHTSAGASPPLRDARAELVDYASRMLRFRQLDLEYAVWFMVNLCISPHTAFRSTLYHSRTKHQWARDDPAFVVVLLYLLLVASVAWSYAFAWRTPLQVLGLYLYIATVDFLLLGALLSTVGWWVANNYLHESAQHSLTHRPPSQPPRPPAETVEWLYAFDVHCNAFLPLYLLLHVLQYLLLPLLLQPGFLVRVLSNVLYAAAFSAYHYLTFLGYSQLPFLTRCEVFVYPIGLVALALALSLPLGLDCTSVIVYIYFG